MGDPTRRRVLAGAHLSATIPLWLSSEAIAQTSVSGTPTSGGPSFGRAAPEAFGALGDGRRDDAPALQSAIDALEQVGGGILVLSNKTYRIDQPIAIDPTKTSISGARAILDGAKIGPGSSLIVVRAKAESDTYQQGTQFLEGLVLVGPGAKSQVTGIMMRTAATGQSTRIALRNLVIRDLSVGIEFSARSYLCQAYSVQVYNTGTGVAFTSDEDAGENISFFGCSIFNSDLAVRNTGGAFANFLGCSFDYCRQWFVGGGQNLFTSCWFEKHRPEGTDDYPFDLTGGELTLLGGGIQISGEGFSQGNENKFMFMIRNRLAHVHLKEVSAWNWRTATDELAGGAGSITIDRIAGVGRKFMPTAIKSDPEHNVFGIAGKFEGSNIAIPCWISGPGADRVSAHEISWRNGGTTYATSSVSIVPDPFLASRRCLRVSKGIGSGTEFAFNIVAPVAPGNGFSMSFLHRMAKPAKGPFWVQIFFVQILRTDEFGVPTFGNRAFWGESEVRYDNTVGKWRETKFNSHNLDETSPTLGFAPAWASHVHLSFNLVALGADDDLWISDLGGWRS